MKLEPNILLTFFPRAGNNWSWVPIFGCFFGGVLGALIYVCFIEMHHDSEEGREAKMELESIINSE